MLHLRISSNKGTVGTYFVSIFLAAIGTIVFFNAFFPAKSGYPDQKGNFSDGDVNSKSNFRMIIMLVDALRADFISKVDSEFSFVNARIDEGSALPFITRAHPPTVTLPRLKSMITGTNPGFMDVAANFNSQASSTHPFYPALPDWFQLRPRIAQPMPTGAGRRQHHLPSSR